jgi:predicted transcriptional regulator
MTMQQQTMSTQVACRLDDEMQARLEEFRADQTIQPNKSEVIRTALDRFLEQEGY